MIYLKILHLIKNQLGVMLPYTPIHILLFSKKLKVLIMTSANVNGLPIEYKDSSARDRSYGYCRLFSHA